MNPKIQHDIDRAAKMRVIVIRTWLRTFAGRCARWFRAFAAAGRTLQAIARFPKSRS
jgi:hypothetical protein